MAVGAPHHHAAAADAASAPPLVRSDGRRRPRRAALLSCVAESLQTKGKRVLQHRRRPLPRKRVLQPRTRHQREPPLPPLTGSVWPTLPSARYPRTTGIRRKSMSLVVGETSRSRNWQLYGYPPHQSRTQPYRRTPRSSTMSPRRATPRTRAHLCSSPPPMLPATTASTMRKASSPHSARRVSTPTSSPTSCATTLHRLPRRGGTLPSSYARLLRHATTPPSATSVCCPT